VAKSRYAQTRVLAILDAIRQQGGDRFGWEAGEISEATFYKWQQQYPEFREEVSQAKNDYRRSCPQQIKKQAQKSLSDYLFNGAIEVWEATETLTDARGQIVSIKQISKTVRRGTPQWVIERVLGSGIHELECLKVLVECGWLTQETLERIAAKFDEVKQTAMAAIQPSSSGLDQSEG
jgi:hypothetical protein